MSTPAQFEILFDGQPIPCRDGWTIGAALTAAGIRSWRTTRQRHRPRGLFCGIGVCFDCLVTVINVYEAGISTTKSSVKPPTYTRTAIVSTSTVTSTVRTKINPTETAYTYSQASALEVRSWYTETTTKTSTVRPPFLSSSLH